MISLMPLVHNEYRMDSFGGILFVRDKSGSRKSKGSRDKSLVPNQEKPFVLVIRRLMSIHFVAIKDSN